MRALQVLLIPFACVFVSSSRAAEEQVDYLRQIKPLLQEKCWACHGVLKQEAGLRLDHPGLMRTGGDSGPAMDLESAPNSLVIERITSHDEDLRMPPVGEGSRLSASDAALLKSWIEQGAKAPPEDVIASPLEHWAFQPLDASSSTSGVESRNGNLIDRFFTEKHHSLGIQTVPPAARSILIRRLYLNVIGLPPTVAQLQDDRPIDQIIDELLASPHHGERWGRHWMDVWRYSDWYGLGKQLRYSQKHLWHWRDWIVRSLNEDKGYDRMILEMLAGDELEPGNPDVVQATGYLARNYYLFNRTTWLDQTIEHTGKAFLGLTLNCAKCHDHKYDPVTQVDYYRFRAFFEPHHIRRDPVPGVFNPEEDGLPRAFDRYSDAVTQLHRRGNPEDPDPDIQITPSVPEIFAAQQPAIQSVAIPVHEFAPGLRPEIMNPIRESIAQAIADAEQDVIEARQALQDFKPAPNSSEESAWQFKESFERLDPNLWEVVGEWHSDGKSVYRNRATRGEEYLKLKSQLPDDFELTCRYTTTGGETYKSVTFRFDESQDRQFANSVYTSAHEPGPKVQVSEIRQGKSVYPAAGRASRPIRIGQPYELKIAVRERLVNVWLDGEFVLSYLLSDRGSARWLSLAGFDSTVAFDWLRVRSLPKTISLRPATNGQSSQPLPPKEALQLALAKHHFEVRRLAEFDAVLAADRCRAKQLAGESIPGANELFREAAIQQAHFKIATVEHQLLLPGTGKEREAAEKQLVEARQKLAKAEQGTAEYLSPMYSMIALAGPDDNSEKHETMFLPTSTGRRLALAKWIVSERNPLMARVVVNHVWMRHFGEPLVESVFDFGLRAEAPLHLELLDQLAAEFIQSGYRFKHLHRLILTSAAYQRSTSSVAVDLATRSVDPQNRFLWRMNTRRMESQVIRDSLLSLAGTLDLTIGGPSVPVGADGRRRSLYFLHSRDQQDQFLSTFDDADLLQCYRRSESVVPQQALALANSKLALQAAEEINREMQQHQEVDTVADFTRLAFMTLLARQPNSEEISECVDFCRRLDSLLASEEMTQEQRDTEVRVRMISSLLNHNDFVSIR